MRDMAFSLPSAVNLWTVPVSSPFFRCAVNGTNGYNFFCNGICKSGRLLSSRRRHEATIHRKLPKTCYLCVAHSFQNTIWNYWVKEMFLRHALIHIEEHDCSTCFDSLDIICAKNILSDENIIAVTENNINQNSFQITQTEHAFYKLKSFPVSKTGKLSMVLMGLGLLIGLTGILICPQAWASTEVAKAEDSINFLGDLGDVKSGFASAFLLIFFSEIGDKTFFIAALLASRKSNAAVYTGTFGALVAMTLISVFLGRTFHYIDGMLPFRLGETELPLDDLAAVVLLVYFGVTTLLDVASMQGSKIEEEQHEAELAIAGIGGDMQATANTAIGTFALVFVAEWGDKSFFSTVALSAASSPLGVILGAVAGHGFATLIAVLGGSFLATYVSEKVIAYTGGTLFLVFAVATLLQIFK
eukprot:c20894_g1_i1 orf=526-1770(+)